MYILLVSDSVGSRDYGVPYALSNISGDVKIVGDLSTGKTINLHNLKIDGDLIVDIGEGDINVYGGHYNNYIIYESGVSHISNDEIGIDIEDITAIPEELDLDEITDEIIIEPVSEMKVETEEIPTESSESIIVNDEVIIENNELINENYNDIKKTDIAFQTESDVNLQQNGEASIEPPHETIIELREQTPPEEIINVNNASEDELIIDLNEEIPNDIPTKIHLDNNSKNSVLQRVINKIKNVLK